MNLEKKLTGNVVRRALEEAGIPSPNKTLVDILAPAILQDGQGESLRQWRFSSAEVRPMIEAMKSDFEKIEAAKDNPQEFQQLVEAAKTKFYGMLQDFETQRQQDK